MNKGVENVHPFKVNDNLVFGHNGIINDVSRSELYSDTQMFNMEILQNLHNLDKDFLSNLVLVKLISEFVSGSKLAFLNSDKTFKIINESDGHWNTEKTIWFSNYGYVKNNVYSYGAYGSHYLYNKPYTTRYQNKALTYGSHNGSEFKNKLWAQELVQILEKKIEE